MSIKYVERQHILVLFVNDPRIWHCRCQERGRWQERVYPALQDTEEGSIEADDRALTERSCSETGKLRCQTGALIASKVSDTLIMCMKCLAAVAVPRTHVSILLAADEPS